MGRQIAFCLLPLPSYTVHHKLALVRRPAGLGQTAFLVAAMLAYEYFTPHVFRDLFGTSPICSSIRLHLSSSLSPSISTWARPLTIAWV
ncbi:hypothetical protein BDZ89DRAFT_748410 [Hymenopellis radicata]|nr:hypothetical protein BDZ89DRAFT_748410 [Hymenopellis radicata]